MKTRTSIALAIVAGFGLGALSIHTLHAQAKPPVYVIAEIDVTNPDAYMKEYSPKAQALTKKHGARPIALGNVTPIVGTAPKRVAVNQWESMEKAKAYYSSAEYKELRKIGDKYATFRIYGLQGVPQP